MSFRSALNFPIILVALAGLAGLAGLGWASVQGRADAEDKVAEARVSPALGITHKKNRGRQDGPPVLESEIRSLDGSGNNLQIPEMGAAYSQLRRRLAVGYGDGISELAGSFRPSARAVSNGISRQVESRPNPRRASDYLWQWGQFLDHDIDLTDGTDPPEPANIPVPAGDAWFDPEGLGTQEIAFNRSIWDPASGGDTPRQQLIVISGWIEASNVYV